VISSDNKWLILRTGDLKRESFRDIIYTALNGDGTLHDIVRNNRSSEFSPVLSRDDRWLAYASDESGRIEVYVLPFPGPGERLQVTTSGGTEPQWSRDGRTLFYRQGRAVKAVALTAGTTMTVGATTTLFEGGYLPDAGISNFDVSADGKQFIMLQSVDRQAETIVVYGWANELRKSWRAP
jgi:hypothetical protein